MGRCNFPYSDSFTTNVIWVSKPRELNVSQIWSFEVVLSLCPRAQPMLKPKIKFFNGASFLFTFLHKIVDLGFKMANIEKEKIGVLGFGNPKTQFWEGVIFLIRFLYKSLIWDSKPRFFVVKFGILRWCLLVLSLCLRAKPMLRPLNPVFGKCHFPI